jgi:hypothetical protein
MTPEEYAKANAGRKVMYGGNQGRIVSYCYCAIGIEFDEGVNFGGMASSYKNTSNVFVVPIDSVQSYMWNCGIGGILLLAETKPAIVQKPYPHTCKACKKPARNSGAVIICSNDKCKSRRKLRATYRTMEPVKNAQVVDEPATYLKSGVRYYLEAWRNGDCSLCGVKGGGRDKERYAHTKCWSDIIGISYNDNMAEMLNVLHT